MLKKHSVIVSGCSCLLNSLPIICVLTCPLCPLAIMEMNVRFEVFMVLSIKIIIFLDVMQYNLEIGTNVLEELVASIFSVEGGGSNFQ